MLLQFSSSASSCSRSVWMEEHCFVLCGDWHCCDDGMWDFFIDK